MRSTAFSLALVALLCLGAVFAQTDTVATVVTVATVTLQDTQPTQATQATNTQATNTQATNTQATNTQGTAQDTNAGGGFVTACPVCPAGQNPVQNNVSTVTNNTVCGVGSTLGLKNDQRFSSCCRLHDECYHQCNTTKEFCDRSFYQCTLAVCSGQSADDQQDCTSTAACFASVLNEGTQTDNTCTYFDTVHTNQCTCQAGAAAPSAPLSSFPTIPPPNTNTLNLCLEDEDRGTGARAGVTAVVFLAAVAAVMF